MSGATQKLAETIIQRCTELKQYVVTAESCTGGLIAGAITDIAGSSAALERGFVTYSNQSKNEMLGVPADLIEEHGAVSEEVVCAMVVGALAHSKASFGVAVTGVAGPGGGSAEKPVGLVYIAAASKEPQRVVVSREIFPDNGRAFIREATVERALTMLLDQLDA